jgi:hypothetical protein
MQILKGRFLEGGPLTVRSYDILPDGKRFLVTLDVGEAQAGSTAPPQIQVVLNWLEELKQRVPLR